MIGRSGERGRQRDRSGIAARSADLRSGELIAAFVVAQTAASFARRALTVARLGLFAWLSISAFYWNWYRFPGAFVVAEGLDQVVGWLLGGLVIAGILRVRRTAAP